MHVLFIQAKAKSIQTARKDLLKEYGIRYIEVKAISVIGILH